MRMMGLAFTKSHGLIIIAALGFYLLDSMSKLAIKNWLALGQSVPVIPGVFHFTHVQNTGVAFSLFHQYPEILTLVASLFLLLLLLYMLSHRVLSRLEMLGFSLVIGGALGNLADRFSMGAVTDFLDLAIIHYPVFNLADSFIFTGVALLIIHYVRHYHYAARS